MASLLNSPKLLVALVAVVLLFCLGLAGGALGNEFGGGFIGSPLAHIQLAAEPILSAPIIRGLPVFGDVYLTNTMVTTWIVVSLLLLLALLGTKNLTDTPGRFQGLLEAILELFLGLAERVAGPTKGRIFFPLFMTIFLFVVTANWLGVLPGFGTIGRFEPASEVIHHAEKKLKGDGDHVDLSSIHLHKFEGDGRFVFIPFGSIDDVLTAKEIEGHGHGESKNGDRAGLLVPFFRSSNTEINTTLAIALIATIAVHWWGIRALGIREHVGKFLNFRSGPIMLFVGLLEGITEFARVLSFTFRLFGNIFAGEVLLIVIAFLVPLVGLVPFLGLELFVGLIQGFIFSMLTLVFATTATMGHGSEGH